METYFNNIAPVRNISVFMEQIMDEIAEFTLCDVRGSHGINSFNWRQVLLDLKNQATDMSVVYSVDKIVSFLEDIEHWRELFDSTRDVGRHRYFALEPEHPMFDAVQQSREMVLPTVRKSQSEYSVTGCMYGRYKEISRPCVLIVCTDPENLPIKYLRDMVLCDLNVDGGTTSLCARGSAFDIECYDQVPPGACIGTTVDKGCKVGTFGGYLYDQTSGDCYGITCAHVIHHEKGSLVFQPPAQIETRRSLHAVQPRLFGSVKASIGPLVLSVPDTPWYAVDWAIFQMDEKRILSNTMPPEIFNGLHPGGPIVSVGHMEYGAHVAKCGFKSGLTHGHVCYSNVKFREMPEETFEWSIIADNQGHLFSHPGDSGAWVVNENNELVGYVIGGSNKQRYGNVVTFVTQMNAVLVDIKRHTNLDLRLGSFVRVMNLTK